MKKQFWYLLAFLPLLHIACSRKKQEQAMPVYLSKLSDSMRIVLKTASALRKENAKDGFYAYLKALQTAKELGDPKAIVEAYRRSIFIAGTELFKTDTAVELAHQAIDYANQLNDANTLCEMYGLLGVAYQAAGILDSAVEANMQALKYMEQDTAPDSLKNWPLYINIADLYSSLGNQRLAIENTEKYLNDYAIKIKDTMRMISSYSNLSNYYTYFNKPKDAEDAIRKAYQLTKSVKNKATVTFVYLGMAAMYNNIKVYDSAFYFSSLCFALCQASGNQQCMTRSTINQLETAVYSKNRSLYESVMAKPFTQNVLADKSLKLSDQKKLSDIVYRGYKLNGKLDSAYNYLEASYNLSNTLRELEINKDLEQYELERKKVMQENALLSKQLQIKNQFNLILLLSLFSLLILAVGIIAFIWYRRKHILQQKKIELLFKEKQWESEKALLEGQLEERNRISRELHDDLGATLTSIVLTSEIIKRKMPEVREEVDNITISANGMADTLNEIVWSLNSRNDSLQSLTAYIRKFSTNLLAKANLEFQFTADIPDDDLPVESDLRRSIYLSTKEIVNNIVKHSKASMVKMNIQLKDDQLQIVIVDNGVGLSKESSSGGGNGLHNIKRNMEMVNGWFRLENANGLTITLGCNFKTNIYD